MMTKTGKMLMAILVTLLFGFGQGALAGHVLDEDALLEKIFHGQMHMLDEEEVEDIKEDVEDLVEDFKDDAMDIKEDVMDEVEDEDEEDED